MEPITTVNVWAEPPQLDPALAHSDDVPLALATLERSRSLYVSIDDEIWLHVFESLRNLRDVLSATGAQLRTRGPRDVRAVLEFMAQAISAYLERYEIGYTQYMLEQGGWEPGWPGTERDWLLGTNGRAADDLIEMRSAIDNCVFQMNSYVDAEVAIQWSEPRFAEYWSAWSADRRKPPTNE